MKPHSHEEHIRHTFDAFCKKVLRNEARDYLDEVARRRNREIPFSDLPVEAMEQLAAVSYTHLDVYKRQITYTVEADNLKAARARLSRIGMDIQGYH